MEKKRKKCASPECEDSFEVKNPKKEYCNIHCKNQAAYLYKLNNYDWEVKKQKARQKNIRILEELLERKFTKANFEELKKLGFDLKASHIPDTDEQNRQVFRYGNIQMILLSQTEVEFFK